LTILRAPANRSLAFWAFLLVLGTVVLLPRPVRAQATPRFELRGDLGVGSMVSSYQRHDLGFGFTAGGGLRPGLRLADRFVLEGAVAGWLFPSDRGGGKASLLGLGARFEPWRSGENVLFAGGHLGTGFTASVVRLAFDLELGLELKVARRVALGPLLRYVQMVATSSDGRDDARFVTAGLSVSWQPWIPDPTPPVASPPPPPPPDTDGDGIPDDRDGCPVERQGPSPDPARPGCPVRDADGDKVPDDQDRCPALAAGPSPDPDQPGCPDGDQDADSIPDHQDQCRTQPPGLNPDPSRPGCPMADRDKDNVPDATDACPDQPGAPSADPRSNGCPGLVLVEEGAIKILRPVYFASNKDRILPRSAPVLAAVAAALEATPTIRKISIQGHTDEQGTPALNLDLSTRRALNVQLRLEELGVPSDRLASEGFGDTRPVASNKSRKGRAANRRVELVIVDPPAGKSAVP
jgi:outer membrane protein OmpA-like peptidoglycan-associated protein